MISAIGLSYYLACIDSNLAVTEQNITIRVGISITTCERIRPGWRPVSQRWTQRSQQKKSPLSSKNIRFVCVCAHIFRNCCLSSGYSALFSAEYRKSSLRNWTPTWSVVTRHPGSAAASLRQVRVFSVHAVQHWMKTAAAEWRWSMCCWAASMSAVDGRRRYRQLCGWTVRTTDRRDHL